MKCRKTVFIKETLAFISAFLSTSHFLFPFFILMGINVKSDCKTVHATGNQQDVCVSECDSEKELHSVRNIGLCVCVCVCSG